MEFEQAMAESDQLMESAKSVTKSGFVSDERFWYPTLNGEGNGGAIIRFLPQKDTSKAPASSRGKHTWESEDGERFFEFCRYPKFTDGCPICKYVKPLWASKYDNNDAIKAERGDKKRRKEFIANILVINDKKKPENNGKIFLYKYGVKIQDKIDLKLSPKVDFEDPINPFNLMKGPNFKLIITQKKGEFRSYDSSQFVEELTPVGSNKEEVKAIWEQLYDLDEFTDDSLYLSHDDMKAKFDDFDKRSIAPDNMSNEDIASDSVPDFDMETPDAEKDDDAPYDIPKEKEVKEEPSPEKINLKEEDDFDFGEVATPTDSAEKKIPDFDL